MRLPTNQRLIATIAYADVFDYPLTEKELRVWMIGGGRPSVSGLSKTVHKGNTYISLPRRQTLVSMRADRYEIAQMKWQMIRRNIRVFTWIPTVTLVGVSGGLAMDNASRDDDIDLFFVTRRRALWLTRLWVTVVADLCGMRRRPNEESVANKVCLNMFMSEDSLQLPSGERDLFAAHEVLQLTPLWERNHAYRDFLTANVWVKSFLPNAWKARMGGVHKIHARNGYRWDVSAIFLPFEFCARALQLWYMRRHRTSEIIRPGMMRFHPNDARVWVKKKYATLLARYDIPLDNVFYHR